MKDKTMPTDFPASSEIKYGGMSMSEPMKKISVIPQDDAPAMMPIPQIPPTQSLIHVLSRAMSDPSVDVEKVERYAALYERAIAREDEIAFNHAMMQAQGEMRHVSADANNSQTKSKYATYAALDAKVRPIYSKHGFSCSFDTADGAPEGCIRIVCFVALGGHSRTYHIDMPADGKGAKGGDVMTKTHATGAGVTYGRRYLLSMIFNLVIGEDNDGNDASGVVKCITQDQADNLRDLLEATGKDRSKFLRWAKVDQVEDIRADYYQSCVNAISAQVSK
jgi:ERF superfamily